MTACKDKGVFLTKPFFKLLANSNSKSIIDLIISCKLDCSAESEDSCNDTTKSRIKSNSDLLLEQKEQIIAQNATDDISPITKDSNIQESAKKSASAAPSSQNTPKLCRNIFQLSYYLRIREEQI